VSAPKRYTTFADFYPFYLSEHTNRMCRRLHFVGTTIGAVCLLAALLTRNLWYVLVGLVAGYLFAWIGHVFFEKNRPATFTYPVYSFMGDWVMWRDILGRRIKL
jgi:hypothetical protein